MKSQSEPRHFPAPKWLKRKFRLVILRLLFDLFTVKNNLIASSVSFEEFRVSPFCNSRLIIWSLKRTIRFDIENNPSVIMELSVIFPTKNNLLFLSCFVQNIFYLPETKYERYLHNISTSPVVSELLAMKLAYLSNIVFSLMSIIEFRIFYFKIVFIFWTLHSLAVGQNSQHSDSSSTTICC